MLWYWSRKGAAVSSFWVSVGWLCLEAGNTCLLLQIAGGISVPWTALSADGVKGLFQGRVVAIVVAVGLDGAEAFDPEIFSAFE